MGVYVSPTDPLPDDSLEIWTEELDARTEELRRAVAAVATGWDRFRAALDLAEEGPYWTDG